MRLRVDDISFEVPRGLEDRSTYSFHGRDPQEELDLRLEFPAGGGTPSDEVIAKLHEQLDGFPVSAFSIDEPSDRELAGKAGKYLRYSFEQDGETVHGITVVANLGSEANPDDWVKLSFTLGLPRADADARVEAVLASLAPAEQPAPAAPAAGWVRRRAGAWAFDVPARLSYPRTHTWRDLDARLSISITIHDLDAEQPTLDEPLVDAADKGLVVVDREDVSLSDGELMRAHLRDDELGEESLVCRSVQGFELGGSSRDPASDSARTCYVQIDAGGPWSAAARVRGLVDELLASVRKEDSP
ncbi:hypothetical protein ENSA5_25460 [Enhygromyxa salina]|uniref:Uncharacterized protein n=1 Tax=Enhygromyxa salina TaxID=215803 RepID=A0A2S9YB19_9BACT|nr:hypothetical protein [Enhygromyxa salina]PRQ02211.1 hypothetical protein ENSA5_25460 [Enhygromyxa salina]